MTQSQRMLPWHVNLHVFEKKEKKSFLNWTYRAHFIKAISIEDKISYSPQFSDTENRIKFTEFHEFWCRKFQNMENTVKSIKTKQKLIKQNSQNCACNQKSGSNLLHLPCFYSLYLLCHYALYMSPKITEFWSLECHWRTQIWHFRKQKNGDFTISLLVQRAREIY